MGATQSTQSIEIPKEIQAAGLFFSNGTHVLGGLQKKKGQWIMSGLGGMREGSEALPQTAFREVLEELLGLFDVNPALLHDLYLKHVPNRALFSEGYINYVYTFEQLESILQMIYDSGIRQSPLYKQFPLTLQDLLFKRLENYPEPVNTSGRPVERLTRSTEVPVLTLLPVQPCVIADEFQKDIQKQHKQSL